jgi:hypothetical protein
LLLTAASQEGNWVSADYQQRSGGKIASGELLLNTCRSPQLAASDGFLDVIAAATTAGVGSAPRAGRVEAVFFVGKSSEYTHGQARTRLLQYYCS